MTLQDQISNDMKEAMKAKDGSKLSTLRMLKSALKNKQIDVQHDLSDEEVMAVVKSQMKQLKDSIESFASAGREDLAEPTRAEVAVLEGYMPAQMGEEELEKIVKEAVANSGATSKADTGKAMGAAMKAVAGRADGARVKEMVARLLPAIVIGLLLALAGPEPVLAEASANGTSAFVVPMVRVARAFLILLGIVSLNMILIGGFTYMISSGRDEVHKSAIRKMSTGILGSILIAAIFTIATVALQNLS